MMFHFLAEHPPEPIRLSFRALIPGHIRQYLKDFQLDAVRFMHNFLAKGEFCVYNDESGLGKQVAIVVLLDAACSSRKCLIIVQNDDRYVSGWEFHFNVLTKTNVMIIKDVKDATDSPHNVYIVKWSTLRTMDDLSKFKFDFIILDNRGQMLNNSFCTSMLLKHYERKINILISSVDITSDLKLLHNVLRLGGRLDPQYTSFKLFEEKFKLPDAKELAYKRVDLEDYFCRRERLADYCKNFRLRRYCHQFETQLPLVKEDRYKINIDLWREKQNATNSEDSSIEFVNSKNRGNEHIKDTQELFEDYCRQRRKEHLQFQQEEELRLQQREREILNRLGTEKEVVYNVVDDEVALINDTPFVIRENSDELVLMSPLLVESDSDPDDIPEICNNTIENIEIVDLSSEEKDEEYSVANTNDRKQIENINKTEPKKKRTRKRTELDKLEEDIVDTLKICDVSKRLSRRLQETENSKLLTRKVINRLEKKNIRNVDINLKTERKSPKNKTECEDCSVTPSKKRSKDSLNMPEVALKENCRTPKSKNTLRERNSSSIKSTPNLNSADKSNKTLNNILKKNKTSNATTPSISKITRSVKSLDNEIKIKQEILDVPKSVQNKTKLNKMHLKREMKITPAGIHHKQTRSMQRLTRSACGSKYLRKNHSLQIDKPPKLKTKSALTKTIKYTNTNKKKLRNDAKAKQVGKCKNKKVIKNKVVTPIKNTQTSIISHKSSQDYESLQCAQRLSDAGVFDSVTEKCPEFLVPHAPNVIGKNSLIPSSLTSSAGFFTESEIVFIPRTNLNNITTSRKPDQVISISSSDNENTISQTSSTNISITSRRTRALKPKRNLQKTSDEKGKISNFTDLLAEQNNRSCAKSPDLFSNCSDLNQLPCTQPNLDSVEPNIPFEGFKIFGSEVKQLQQHYAFNKEKCTDKYNSKMKKTCKQQRSCLDILEKMFEPSNKKTKQMSDENLPTSSKKASRVATAASIQKIQTPILPSHPIEAITEARQQQELRKRKCSTTGSSSGLQDDNIFEITNNGSFGSVMRLYSNGNISPVQNTQKTNAKQHNKITNYLIGNTAQHCSQEDPTPNSGNSICTLSNEPGTPNIRLHQVPAEKNNGKKSPKGKCSSTQSTKLTKWFTKPSKKTPNKQMQVPEEHGVGLTITTESSPTTLDKRILKRRRLDLSFNK